MSTRPTRPEAPAAFATDVLEALDRLGLAAVADPLRPLVDAVSGLDEAEEDLPANADASRRRLIARLDAGEVTPLEALDLWREATARVAAAGDVRRMVANVRGRRSEAAVKAIGEVPWWDVLTDPGREAAERVATLAAKLGPDMTDARALRSTDSVRKLWTTEFPAAVARWRGLVDLARTLIANRCASHAPISEARLTGVVPSYWQWEDPLKVPGGHGGDELGGVLAAVDAGARPAFVTPVELAYRLERRDRIADANVALAQRGVVIPGVDVPEDVQLPAQFRELYRPIPA